MIGGIVAALGLPDYLKSPVLTGIAVFVLCVPASYCKGRVDMDTKWKAQIAVANAEVQKHIINSNDIAANQRLNDAIENAKNEKELTDAVSEMPDTAPDPVRVRLGCERLRQSGADTTGISACQ